MLASVLAKTGWAATQRGAMWQVTRQLTHSHTPRSSRTLRQLFSSAVKIIYWIWNWLPCDTETMAHYKPYAKWVAKSSLTFRGEQCRTKNFVANLSVQLCSYGFFVCAKETSMWKAGITKEYTNLRRYSHMFRQYNLEQILIVGCRFHNAEYWDYGLVGFDAVYFGRQVSKLLTLKWRHYTSPKQWYVCGKLQCHIPTNRNMNAN